MAVHVFGGGMRHDVSAPFNGSAVNGRCERIVNDQRYAVCVSRFGELLDIQNGKSGICDRFSVYGFGVRMECSLKFFFGAVG